MAPRALVCLAHGTEETEAVTTIDLLVRGGIEVITASVEGDGCLNIVCSRGVKLIADYALVDVADEHYDVVVLPGGVKGAECFRDSPLLVERVRQTHLSGNIVAAICAAPALVLEHHKLFPVGNMAVNPGFKHMIPDNKWVDRRVNYDERVNLVTSQGPGTSIDFGLKLIELLVNRDKAAEVAGQLIVAPGIYAYL
ncbi:protein deglycase YajL [Budviciaceae bacterium CWB-B4]|uniref:Protein deglycase YajL n=1 Tax=Limnobaculum xujianqingii TaxID=2738837 RepID=A0A9D7AJH0_9GAMM|nr:protein deglycase YajL [Limnobaculum xujianqingii]MBK5074022.1 protein deglycase YajL [Limnobaculum xujianqingii]MBK5177084.1 protein deglycase YajL [Limnobaculum xujianqingii]